MAHNLDMSNNRANIAFLGNRNDVWHRLGQEMAPGMSVDDWAIAAGLNWEAVKVPAIASLEGSRFDHIEPAKRFAPVPDRFFMVRNDTAHVLSPGAVSDVYQAVQPIELLRWFDRYIGVDDRFQLDVAGSLKCGETIWATATYRDPLNIAGDKHIARVLMSTTFDGSGATINQGTMTRVVCNNTLNAALADKRAVIRTRHNTAFDAARVGKELATVAQGFAEFKKVGDAMAQAEMAKDDVSRFFREILDIPFEAKAAEVSGRKLNQFQALSNSYRSTVAEGTEPNTVWAALNAVTRYVDHDRSTRGSGVSSDEKQFTSAQFGSGAGIKAKAMELLMPRIKDRVLVAA